MTADNVLALYQHGSLVCAAIVAVYLLLRWGVGHVPFLQQPAHAHYATIAVTIVGVFAVPAAAGVAPTLNMALAAIGTLAALVLPGLTASPGKSAQSGKVSLTMLACLGLAAMLGSVLVAGGCSWWTKSGKADTVQVGKTAGKAAEACAISDLEKYGSQVAQDLEGNDYTAALNTFEKNNNLSQDAVNCLVTGILAGVGAVIGELHGEPNPIILHGKAYLAAQKTAMLDVYSARWLTAWDPHCESSRETPAVDCRPYESEHYDGCHWTCEAR